MITPEIWLIDDDPFYTPALQQFIEMDVVGSHVQIFKVGTQVTQSLNEGRMPSCVILDMMLPLDNEDTFGELPLEEGEEAPGAVIARQLIAKGLPPSCIAVITVLSDKRYHLPLLKAGVAEQNILLKPARVEDIRQVVRRIVSAA